MSSCRWACRLWWPMRSFWWCSTPMCMASTNGCTCWRRPSYSYSWPVDICLQMALGLARTTMRWCPRSCWLRPCVSFSCSSNKCGIDCGNWSCISITCGLSSVSDVRVVCPPMRQASTNAAPNKWRSSNAKCVKQKTGHGAITNGLWVGWYPLETTRPSNFAQMLYFLCCCSCVFSSVLSMEFFLWSCCFSGYYDLNFTKSHLLLSERIICCDRYAYLCPHWQLFSVFVDTTNVCHNRLRGYL